MSGYDPHRIDDKPCVCEIVGRCQDAQDCRHAVVHSHSRGCYCEGFSGHIMRKLCGGWCMPALEQVVIIENERPA